MKTTDPAPIDLVLASRWFEMTEEERERFFASIREEDEL